MTINQQPLPGLEDYICTLQCLKCKLCPGICSPPDSSACPYVQCLCPANDWGEDEVKYSEFFWWRLEHLTNTLKRQLMEPGSDLMIITPDCLDQFYIEPDPTGMTYRCNRCLSTNLEWQPECIICRNCDWSKPLYDFPVAKRY